LAEKYAEGRDEIANFIRSASDLLAEMNFLLQYGVWRLDRGMRWWKYVDKKPSFDLTMKKPSYLYEEKNYYVNASNNLWQASMWSSYSAISEIYYSVLLDGVKDFKERNDQFDFNKGIVYANLGVAQSAQMKLDEGFANILKALHEDSIYSPNTTPEDNLRKSGLFTQFEGRYVKVYLERIIAQLGMPQIADPKNFIEAFMESLNKNQRVFFDYTFAKNIRSWEIWKEKENGFTANRLLAYTQDFCLFNEDLLKSKIDSAILNSRQYWILNHLLPLKFPNINLNQCQANTMQDLNNILPAEFGKANQPEKCLRILLILRNYSSHNVGGGTGADYFYNHYEDIVKELVRAMCEIALLPNPIVPVTTTP